MYNTDGSVAIASHPREVSTDFKGRSNYPECSVVYLTLIKLQSKSIDWFLYERDIGR